MLHKMDAYIGRSCQNRNREERLEKTNSRKEAEARLVAVADSGEDSSFDSYVPTLLTIEKTGGRKYLPTIEELHI
jgi:hypothetical protein